MKNKLTKFILAFLLVFTALSLFSCRVKEKGDGQLNDGNANNDASSFVFNETTDPVIVLGDGLTSDDVKPLLEGYVALKGHMTNFAEPSKFDGKHGIIIGKTSLDLSKKVTQGLSEPTRLKAMR